MKLCTVIKADQHLGGCGPKGEKTCCKDCVAKSCCASVCTKAYEGKCEYEKEKGEAEGGA